MNSSASVVRCSLGATALSAIAFASLLAIAPARAGAADDAFVCMEETQEICDRQNRNLDLFIQGRDVFDSDREIGDFTKSRAIGRELVARGDEAHGQALLKFIYVQVSLGVHRNFVEAYRWIDDEIASGVKFRRLDLGWVRDKLAARMSPEQLAEARKPRN